MGTDKKVCMILHLIAGAAMIGLSLVDSKPIALMWLFFGLLNLASGYIYLYQYLKPHE